ncbi:MAG: class I SAM-dependent methyltransferase [Candidatus Eremiobacteraeota bacterium]|nr:class I SAM-dependent methyltransferase [Candidatus Eremiobacteraeota bacterium]
MTRRGALGNFQSKTFFNAVATEYDAIVGEVPYAAELEPFLNAKAGIGRMLDVGAGTGKSIEAVLRYAKPEAIVAVDISREMLERLAEKYPSVEIVHSDVAQYLATDPEPFDLITAFGVFELLPEVAPLLGALTGKLKPGGLFCFSYEPLLVQHSTQGRSETTYRIDVSPNVTYTMYRLPAARVLGWVAGCDLLTLAHRALPDAYVREDGPVELRFVAALRPS